MLLTYFSFMTVLTIMNDSIQYASHLTCENFILKSGHNKVIICYMTIMASQLYMILLSMVWTARHVIGYPEFQLEIPNGNKVPNPCNRTLIWAGVGHLATVGSGPANPFGIDFQANSFIWNKVLCQTDSDGDGMTNGEELGDPSCKWTVGSNPSTSTNLTHPGICEPINSTLCLQMNTWLNCNAGFNCPAINNTGVKNATLRFPVSPIPNVQTTYICRAFTLPNDSVTDIIAIQPIIDNSAILHHMIIYGCNSNPEAPMNESFACAMGGGQSCLSMIGLWSVGGLGQCLNDQMGFRIGPTGFQYAIVQLHWNNYYSASNLTDSSGFRIYYTSQLRPNRGQILAAGQVSLAIPPGQPAYPVTGSCTSTCTQQLPQSISITTAAIHMHLLGISGNVSLYRNGIFSTYLAVIPQYSFNSPTVLQFSPPIPLNPGDEIRVTCFYNSMSKNTTTNYGESTSDEMCFGFFTYYPLVDYFDACIQYGSVDICNSDATSLKAIQFPACNFTYFQEIVVYANYSCAKNCSSKTCIGFYNTLIGTNCTGYSDAMAFINKYYPAFITNVLNQCSSNLPLAPASGNLVSSTTIAPPPQTSPINYWWPNAAANLLPTYSATAALTILACVTHNRFKI